MNMKTVSILGIILLGAALATPAADDGWFRDAVFYEVFVRSFFDSNGDGIGDLNGLTAKLDYLNDGNPATARRCARADARPGRLAERSR